MLDIIFRNQRVHIHLDWHDTELWLDSYDMPIKLAWHDDQLVGVMATSIPLYDTCWLRLVAVADGERVLDVLRVLWARLTADLRQLGIHTVAVLIVNEWLKPVVPHFNFIYQEDIVTLRREGRHIPRARSDTNNYEIRVAEDYDLRQMAEIDQSAFRPPWQLSYEDLRQARRISTHCTVALDQDEVIGYQLSTLYRRSGHLARLAVHPDYQGQGIGGALLENLIRHFVQRSILTLTVNTQASNNTSQRLYLRYGFQLNGYDLPVWLATL